MAALARSSFYEAANKIGLRDCRSEVSRQLSDNNGSRIERDIKDGVLPPTTRPAALAGLVLAVTQGMSVLARDGPSRASLLAMAKAALRAWPVTEADDRALAK